MSTTDQSSPKVFDAKMDSSRIPMIDALRGFALAGIVFTHMLENYIAYPVPQVNAELMNPELLDQIIIGLSEFLLRGKFFALFSFLFGLSFFLQMESGAKKRGYYGFTFLWRIVILMAIGFIHSCLYRGDILLIYAVLAIPLIPFYKLSSKIIWGVVILLFSGVPRYLVFHFFKDAPLFVEEPLLPDSPGTAAYIELLQNGSAIDILKDNAKAGIISKFEFQWGVFSRGYLTFGFFLLGLLAGRSQIFRSFGERKRFFKRSWITGLVMMLISVGGMAYFFGAAGEFESFDQWTLMFGLTFFDLFNLGMTLLILALFVLSYRKIKGETLLKVFVPYGRMALTNYLLQSVAGSFIFYSWGFGLAGTLPNRYSFLMAVALVIIQIRISRWWLGNFRYGPVEWLWRSLTQFKRYPLRFNE